MAGLNRKPLQGIANIITFNWHYYVVALVLIAVLIFSKQFLTGSLNTIITVFILLAVSSIIFSLAVSCYVYDFSPLYALTWLDNFSVGSGKTLVNIHAGFDETSSLLKQKYPQADLVVFDFYDKSKHTEISIERARKACLAFPGTKTISTNAVPLAPNSVDSIFLILSAHEIRNTKERIIFFGQLQSAIKADGKIIVVEHLRDVYNFIAYNFGFFHFYPRSSWQQVFAKAGLTEITEAKITPFISVFILQHNGTAS